MEKTTQFQRDRIIDIGKALGIICVALYHLIFMMLMTDATLVIPTPESQTSINFQFNFFNFVAFVLPFFYFASAFTYNPKKRTLKQDIIRKITHQLIPFVLITIFIIIIGSFIILIFDKTNFFISLGRSLYSFFLGGMYSPFEIPALGIVRNPDTGLIQITDRYISHFWFIQALIPASIIFMCFVRLFTKEKTGKLYHVYRGLLIIVMLLLACIEPYVIKTWSIPLALGKVPFAVAIMLAGYWLKEIGLYNITKKHIRVIVDVSALALAIVSSSLVGGTIYYAMSSYGPFNFFSLSMCYINGIAGTVLIMELSKLLAKIKTKWFAKSIDFIGQNSLPIYLFHWLVQISFGQIIRLIPNNPYVYHPNLPLYIFYLAVVAIFFTIPVSLFGGRALLQLFNRLFHPKKDRNVSIT